MRDDPIPTVRVEPDPDDPGVYKPCCGEWKSVELTDEGRLKRHPATPLDEPATFLCRDCNDPYYVIEDSQ